jgi:hypothetical protein
VNTTPTEFQTVCLKYWEQSQGNFELFTFQVLADLGLIANEDNMNKICALMWVSNEMGKRTGRREAREAAK